MSGTSSNMRLVLERRKGQRDQILKELERSEADNKRLYLEALYCEEAQVIIINVAKITQEELEYHIGELVTLALASVFDNPYQFGAEFVQRRNRTECDLFFLRNGARIDPLSASGGGAVDVASFALRMSLWSLANPRTRNTVIEDEPLKWLKGLDLPEKGAVMRKEISEKLGVQLICISHIPEQMAGADQLIEVKLRNGVSQVTIN